MKIAPDSMCEVAKGVHEFHEFHSICGIHRVAGPLKPMATMDSQDVIEAVELWIMEFPMAFGFCLIVKQPNGLMI